MGADAPIVDRPGSANPQRALVMAIALPIVAFVVFGITLMMGYPRDRYSMIGLAILTTAIALVPIILDQARPSERRHLLLTMYCLLFIAHFAVPIFTQYAISIGPSDPPGVAGGALMPADVVRGQWVVLSGLIGFLLGYAVLPMRLRDRAIEQRSARDWPQGIVLTVAIVMLILGWTAAIAGVLGIIPTTAGSGVINTVASSVIFGNALLTVAYLRHRSRLALALLAIAIPVSSALGFLTGSKRSTLIVPAIVLFTSMLLGGRLRARWIVAGVVGMTLLYPVAQFYRQDVLQSNTLTIVDALSDPSYTFGVLSDFVSSSRPGRYLSDGLEATAARLDTIGIVSVIVRDTPSVSPFQNGRTLGLFFVAFIPRIFWPSKPEITLGQWITDVYGSGPHIRSYTGPGFIGDLYLNFGVVSVVLGMFVLGALLRLIQVRFLGPRPTAVGVLVAIIVMAQLIIKQVSSAAYVLSSTAFALLPVLAVYLIVAYFTHGRVRLVAPNGSDEPDDARIATRI